MSRLIKWLATAGGLGELPIAAGTWGSLLGVGLGLLTRSLALPVQAGLVVAGFLFSVGVSGAAEREFGVHDSQNIVIDEVWAMWAVFVAVPAATQHVILGLTAFVLFRVFDIVKPPPLKLLSRLPGGWGIVCDDLGAAAYTVLIFYGASTAGAFAWR